MIINDRVPPNEDLVLSLLWVHKFGIAVLSWSQSSEECLDVV